MKKIKGFTLIELIIVMAILTILMAAIMQMFKPIRSTYVDATLYESQRTAQNGIVQYITESVRYSTDLGLYTKDNTSNITSAVDEFTQAYLRANGVYSSSDVALPEYSGKTPDPDYSAKYTKTLEKMKRTAEVIVIDNENTYVFNNVGFSGRLLRRKFVKNSSYTDGSDPTYKKYEEITNDAEDPTKTKECRIALGAPYYGDRFYTIALENGNPDEGPSDTWGADDGIGVTVASYSKLGRDSSGSLLGKGAYVSTAGNVVCKNQCTPINGMFDISNFTQTSSTGSGTKVYIVYINEKVTIET